MSRKREVSIITIIIFSFFIISSSYANPCSQSENKDKEISDLLKTAEQHYENGDFKKAIEIYEKIIQLLNEKKEFVETKQKLYQTMLSLALTYFAIQENEKAENQLEKLIRVNPNQELDPEFYSPKFIKMFKAIQSKLICSIEITSAPENAEIYLNDKKVGNTPLTIKKIIKGDYELRAELKGFFPDKRNITIAQGVENRVDIILKRSEEKPAVVEKPVKKPKKKKKSSALLIVVGIAVVAAAVLVLSKGGKKTPEPEPRLLSRIFNGEPFEIKPDRQSAGVINVQGIPDRVEKIEYRVVVEFPAMRDLFLSIVGTDQQTGHTIWNRGGSQDQPTIIQGTTQVFNSINPNGNWLILVRNNGEKEGAVAECVLKIYYWDK